MRQQDILIVEDELLNAKFLEDILITLGHKVVGVASSADRALEIFRESKVDFVFMDINLSGVIDGIQCAKLLNDHRDVPIIFVTGFGESDIIAEASETNLYGYLIKPYDERDIEAVLSVAIHKYNALPKIENRESIKLAEGYYYDKQNKILFHHQNEIKLTKKEVGLLDFLVLHINQHLSYDSILQDVWEDKNISHSAIRDTVLRIRKKAPLLQLDNIAGVGYCLRVKM